MSPTDEAPPRGLPDHLPAGERLLWQGAPAWRALAIRAFHVRKIAIYCGLLMSWSLVGDLYDGRGVGAALATVLWLTPLALVAVALPTGLAWLYARTTVYSITDRRLVLRIGVALPISVNLPYSRIMAADLRRYRDGTGDLALRLAAGDRIAYLALWPHARPWRVGRPEPMLRCLPNPAVVVELLARAMAAQPASPAATVASHGEPVAERPLVGVAA